MADFSSHPEIEEAVKNKNKNHVSVFFRKELNSGHRNFRLVVSLMMRRLLLLLKTYLTNSFVVGVGGVLLLYLLV